MEIEKTGVDRGRQRFRGLGLSFKSNHSKLRFAMYDAEAEKTSPRSRELFVAVVKELAMKQWLAGSVLSVLSCRLELAHRFWSLAVEGRWGVDWAPYQDLKMWMRAIGEVPRR